MMSGVPLETCWAFKKLWNNKFYYKAASCWYFYWVIYDAWIHEYQITKAVFFSSLSEQTCITNLKILLFWTIQQSKIFDHFKCAVHQFQNQASSLATQLWVKYKRNCNDTWKMLRWSCLLEPCTASSWHLGQEGVVWRYKLHTFLTVALRENPEQHLLRTK